MKDRILAAYLKDFGQQFGLADLGEAEAFEQFTNYCVISKHHPDRFDPDDVTVGGGGDLGLDGVGMLVNEHLVRSSSDVDYLKKSRRRLDVQFIFIQAKTSPRFEAADIGAFVSGVREFFEPSPPAVANDAILDLYKIKEYIFDSSIDMDQSPICSLYYVTTGVWMEEPALRTRIEQGMADISRPGSFRRSNSYRLIAKVCNASTEGFIKRSFARSSSRSIPFSHRSRGCRRPTSV
jgi:hypothetical protein